MKGIGSVHAESRVFEQAVDLRQEEGAEIFLGQPRAGSTLVKTYGGHTFAQGLVSASLTVDPRRTPFSAHGYFLSPGDTSSGSRYEVERVRDGRSVSARNVVAHQGSRQTFRMLAAFGAPVDGYAHSPRMPQVPSPAEVPSLFDVMPEVTDLDVASWRQEWEFLDPRYILDSAGGKADNVRAEGANETEGRQLLWIALPDTTSKRPFAPYWLLAYISDFLLLSASLLPHGLACGAPDLPRATFSHSVHFHAPPTLGEWVLVEQTSEWAGGGRGLARGRIFSTDGRLLASLSQEGFMLPRRTPDPGGRG